MAIKTKAELKKYFEAGKRPTQQQFYDLIDNIALLSQIPDIPIKPYKVFSAHVNGDSTSEFMLPTISYVPLESTYAELDFSLSGNRIGISPPHHEEFNLSKVFIVIGSMNDSCNFDKVLFSTSESTETELVLYCIINSEFGVIRDPTVIFNNLPIEIRFYD